MKKNYYLAWNKENDACKYIQIFVLFCHTILATLSFLYMCFVYVVYLNECTMIVLPLGHSKITKNRPHPLSRQTKDPIPLGQGYVCQNISTY